MTEFDCIECGRHIFQFGEHRGPPNVCGTCVYMPGWFRDKALRERLDPHWGHTTKHNEPYN